MQQPVTTFPELSLQLDGSPLEAAAEALASVTIIQQLSRPAVCELRYLDPRGPLAEGSLVRAGAELTVRIGDSSETLFRGDVTAVDFRYEPARGREIRIRAGDRLHRLRQRQPVRSHVEVTLEDLARELLVEDGVSVRAVASGSLRKKLMQFRQTDFDLLAETAAAEGLYFVLHDQVLHLVTLEGLADNPAEELTLGRELLEARVELNGAGACSTVSASGWNPWTAESFHADARGPRVGLSIDASIDPDQLHTPGEWHLVDEAVQLEAQTQAMAQAELDDRAARLAVLEGVADGNAVSLAPGARLELRGVAAELCGSYVAAKVSHCIDHRRGYVIEFSTSPPELVHRPWSPILTFGVVTDVADPEGAGRVKVIYPSYADLESDWLEVVIPGAGSDKGLAALPDTDDRVLVAFVRGDAAQAVVLGGLWGTGAPPDDVVQGDAIKRFSFRTPGGQLVRLDDANESLHLENSDGSFIEMTPSKVRIHATADLDIEAPGQKVTIRGRAINFDRA